MENFKNSPIVKKLGFNRIVLCCVLLLMYAMFAIVEPSFVSYSRIISALNYAYFLGFLALGVTFVIATGEYHTVREFTTLAFARAGIELEWKGEGLDEKGIDRATGRVLVEVDPKYFRPAEVDQLLGDPTKARTKLGWNPRKTSFQQLVNIMVDNDLRLVKNDPHNVR